MVGDGVLAAPRRSTVGIDELALRPDGMPMGVAVAFMEILRLLDDLGKPALALRLMLLLYGDMFAMPVWLVSGGASCMVMSIKSGSRCAGITGVGGTTCGCCSLTLLADSLDFLGGGIAWLALDAIAAPSCCPLPPSSESTCSHSSGSSTSASRSAAALQFGQIKIGYEGDASSDLIHL